VIITIKVIKLLIIETKKILLKDIAKNNNHLGNIINYNKMIIVIITIIFSKIMMTMKMKYIYILILQEIFQSFKIVII